jgi:hypothetical protein
LSIFLVILAGRGKGPAGSKRRLRMKSGAEKDRAAYVNEILFAHESALSKQGC